MIITVTNVSKNSVGEYIQGTNANGGIYSDAVELYNPTADEFNKMCLNKKYEKK